MVKGRLFYGIVVSSFSLFGTVSLADNKPGPSPTNTYYILSVADPAGKVIDLPSGDAGNQDGNIHAIRGNASQFQKWVIEPLASQPGLYTIRSALDNTKFLEPNRGTTVGGVHTGGDPNGDDDRIGWYPPSNSAYQHWRFEEGGGNHVFIVNDGSGKYMHLSDDQVQQKFKLTDDPTELWYLQPIS